MTYSPPHVVDYHQNRMPLELVHLIPVAVTTQLHFKLANPKVEIHEKGIDYCFETAYHKTFECSRTYVSRAFTPSLKDRQQSSIATV